MPEILEIEYYRRAAGRALDRRIAAVDAADDWYLKKGTTAAELAGVLVDHAFVAARRRGKLLLLDTDGGSTLGLRFGMTGRLIVDDHAPIEELEYSSGRDEPAWDRFGIDFADGGLLRIRDPRRLGGVVLDPDEGRLGADAFTISAEELATALAGSTTALKARLLDQARVAGLGNLLTDEILWRAGLAPARAAGSLGDAELDRLHSVMTATLDDLLERGGSHMGELQDQRHRDGRCPADGEPLRRETVGGRTTLWCPTHQR